MNLLELDFVSRLLHFRVLKTVAASFLALVVAYLLGFPYPMFPALAACFCIRQTFIESVRTFVVEVKITFHATVLSLAAGGIMELTRIYDVQNILIDFLIVSLALGGVIVVIQYFEWYNSGFVGLLTVLYVLLLGSGQTYDQVFLARGVRRFFSIVCGSFIALNIDYLFSGFEYSKLFHRRTRQAFSSLHTMVTNLVDAILLQDREKAEYVLDETVDRLNLLNYVSDKLDDLAEEMEFRGDEIHGFTREQLRNIESLIRDLRLIGFQLEAAAINYIRLVEFTQNNGREEPLPEADYAQISAKGRELAEYLDALQTSLDRETIEPLGEIPRVKRGDVDYSHLFEDIGESDLRFIALDIMSAIQRIEFHLGRLADRLEEYHKLRQGLDGEV